MCQLGLPIASSHLPVIQVSLNLHGCLQVMSMVCTGSPPEALHCAGKGPLYLQHEGHSRTIIGIEKVFRSSGQPPAVAFLILDPSTRTGPLDRALRERKGWQVRLQPSPACVLGSRHAFGLDRSVQSSGISALRTMLPVPLTITNSFQRPPQSSPVPQQA